MEKEQSTPIAGEAVKSREGQPVEEVEAYKGQVEWRMYIDGKGRVYRFGLIELTKRAGKSFVYGSNEGYKLVVLFDAGNTGHAYAFKEGNGEDNDFLSSRYVAEKLGRALYFEKDAVEFTRRLGALLKRPTD